MRRGIRRSAICAGVLALLGLAPAAASAATKHCQAPLGGEWEQVKPARAGMDAAKLQDAIDYASEQQGLAVRVFRHGCLVGADRGAAANDGQRYESWSLGKSVASIAFGAAMTRGDLHPSDRVGALLPEADAGHGAVRLRDLLTMTSGVHWNGARDYNIFTQTDRVNDWLTLPMDHEPGTFFEYAQSAVAIVPKAIERATGKDPRGYLQKHVLDGIGIESASWEWQRDSKGNVEGFWGARMRTADFARLGELLRRGGRWRGERILSRDYVRRAIRPSNTNGCYGWLIWVNSAKPCIGPRITNRHVVDEYGYPGTPRDMYVFSGLFGQIVAVFPTQGLVVARNGQDSPTTLAGATAWQIEFFQRVLKAIVDEPVTLPDDGEGEVIENYDGGFQDAFFKPEEYQQGASPPPPPPAGPTRVRAPQIRSGGRGIRGIRAFVRIHCPPAPEGASQLCDGRVGAKGALARGYEIAAGESERIGLRLRRSIVKRLIARGAIRLRIRAHNRDAAGGSGARERLRYRDAAERDRKGF